MWQSNVENLSDGRGQKFRISSDGRSLSVADAVSRWRDDVDFRSFITSLLVAAPYEAFRWETPAITSSTTNRDFEFVLLDSPGLITNSDPTSFAAYFASDDARDGVVTFPNLGKDAVLVVPTPVAKSSKYGHLAEFVRTAPNPQIHALWRAVGDAMQRRIGQKPVWLSTAGMGVAWLHVRLDDRPKYYGHGPYRNAN